MANYRFESGPQLNLERSQMVGEARKTYVWTDPIDSNQVVKIRKQNFLRRFDTPDEAIKEIGQRDSNRKILVNLLEGIGLKSPDKLVVKETYVIYPLQNKYEYDIEQKRVFGETLDVLRIKVLQEDLKALQDIGKVIQAHIILRKQNKTIDLLGSQWPNGYTKIERIARPFLPILFSKNIMVGKLDNEDRLPYLVDSGVATLKNFDDKSSLLSKKILLGSYISLLLLEARIERM